MKNLDVLVHVYLDAVFTNFEILATDDPESAKLISGKNLDILFAAGVFGPKATISIRDNRIKVLPGKVGSPDITMFFPKKEWMTNMLSKKGFGIPIPLIRPWRLHKALGLMTFMKLGDRLDAILQGPNPPVTLKARLLLNTIAKAVAVICNYEDESKGTASKLRGAAELCIRGGDAVNILFTGHTVAGRSGHADDYQFQMEFSREDVFLKLVDDQLDVMASIVLGEMTLSGDFHMADVLNGYLDKTGEYLQ